VCVQLNSAGVVDIAADRLIMDAHPLIASSRLAKYRHRATRIRQRENYQCHASPRSVGDGHVTAHLRRSLQSRYTTSLTSPVIEWTRGFCVVLLYFFFCAIYFAYATRSWLLVSLVHLATDK